MTTDHGLLDADEAAERLRVHKATVLKWARDGQLNHIKISARKILFRADDIEALVEERAS